MAADPFCLLDTSILVALVRAGPLGQYVDQTYHLTDQPFRPLISVVTVGEVLKLVKGFGWQEKKVGTLRRLLGHVVWVDINSDEVLDAYAEIAHWSERNGKTKPQNDYWIAATAKVVGATLLTTDKHFDDYHGTFVQRIWFDESQFQQ
jgi:predicted nucleic acid-binding protein